MKSNIEKVIRDAQQDPQLKDRDEVIFVCLDRTCTSMLEDAFLLSGGELRRIVGTSYSNNGDQADDAAIRLSEDGDDLVSFHETRNNSRDHRPNGIRVKYEELDRPCVVFCNSGEEPLTVDCEWVSPGDYTIVQEVDVNSPEAQEALEAHLNSPEVLEAVRQAQEMFQEKERERDGR